MGRPIPSLCAIPSLYVPNRRASPNRRRASPNRRRASFRATRQNRAHLFVNGNCFVLLLAGLERKDPLTGSARADFISDQG
jgi:hypothetical protein